MSQSNEKNHITALLKQCEAGDKAALNKLAEDVYPVLKRIAIGQLKKKGNRHTISPTVLVHEVFITYFLERKLHPAKDRVHFYAMIARAMQWFLLEHARAKGAQRRGQFAIHLTLNEALDGSDNSVIDLLVLEELLNELGKRNPRLLELVQLKCFCGFSNEECASALEISLATVKREWSLAQAWFKKRINPKTKAA